MTSMFQSHDNQHTYLFLFFFCLLAASRVLNRIHSLLALDQFIMSLHTVMAGILIYFGLLGEEGGGGGGGGGDLNCKFLETK